MEIEGESYIEYSEFIDYAFIFYDGYESVFIVNENESTFSVDSK